MARRALSPAHLALVQAVRAGLAEAVPAPPGHAGTAGPTVVRLACSGGADSLALAGAMAWLEGHEPDPLRRVCALVVDHGLQDGSAEVARRTVATLRGLGLDADAVRVRVDRSSPDGLEAAARDARYDALAGAGAEVVLLGHTLDDQAETVLLGLCRGSGVRSLAGMPPAFRWRETGPVFLRPLLGLRRTTTAQACADWNLAPWDDPMNDDDRFARVRARRLLPVLEGALGPGVAQALARTAALARVDADHLDAAAEAALAGLGEAASALPVGWLAGLPPALRGRVLRRWLADQGVEPPGHDHTAAVWALVTGWHGQARVDLPGAAVVRADGALAVRPPAGRAR